MRYKESRDGQEKRLAAGLTTWIARACSLWQRKAPVVGDNTFLVWEPCSTNHAEIVPGYVKYLVDLGYQVSVLVTPARLREGLFCRFDDDRVFLNTMSQRQIRKHLAAGDLESVKGILITTAGKITARDRSRLPLFAGPRLGLKVLLVEHNVKPFVDQGCWQDDTITLREIDYQGARSVVVNPHYFGNVEVTAKNDGTTRFVTVGALRARKKNTRLIIESVLQLHRKGIRAFKVTVIGKRAWSGIPREIREYFDVRGRLSFREMYREIENADFLLTAYDVNNPHHHIYRTTGTSGSFQLCFGFRKPCLIVREFATINGFGDANSVVYECDEGYPVAMARAIEMGRQEYAVMQEQLARYADRLYQKSLENLRKRIHE